MADIVLTGDTSGAITVAAPAVAGTNTITLPAETGTIVTSTSAATNTPAFSASISANQSLSETTFTKLAFDTEQFDTDSAFDTSTNRFTVPAGKAGLYSISAIARLDSQANSNLLISQLLVYKNGVLLKRSYKYFSNNYIRLISHGMTIIPDLAVGDYIEMYGYINAVDNTGGQVNSGVDSTFSGYKLIT